ncbi:DNA helicase [Yersinia phage vB_Yru_GN1]|uniref:DNA helicase n=1 Tax=Yersinia phage vB_Yru_GN1 TaxID=3074381 RepID=A0AA86JHJ0_9CAUD|nr:DNA helicase [Yersinia phage vB_Yru_GN1]
MITEAEVLKVLKEGIPKRNNDSLVRGLGLSPSITVKNFDPRPYQLELLTQIINEIIHNGKRDILLNLPTGSGKSFIAEALTMLLDHYGITSIEPFSKNIVLTFRNNLIDQYLKSFKYMYNMKGKSNYKCLLNYRPVGSKTKCVAKGSHTCDSRFTCEYFLSRTNFYKSQSMVTNYNWYVYNFNVLDLPLLTGTLVMDEVHTCFDILDEIFNINLDKLADKARIYHERVNPGVPFEESQLHSNIKNRAFSDAEGILSSMEELLYEFDDILSELDKYLNLREELSLLKIIEDFNVPPELSKVDRVKYVFRKIIRRNHSRYDNQVNIFMSATITKEFFTDHLYEADESKLLYINMDPIFPKENRPLYSMKSLPTFNYDKMNDKEFLDIWSNIIMKITDFHKNDKGFIYVNSYAQARELKTRFYKNPRFIINDNASNATTTLKRFMQDKSNLVLISPVIQEGYSFDDDMSRFQIIAKVPFVNSSLIKEYGEKYYYQKTVIALLQIIGRSVRNPTDYASTYMIDSAWKLLNKYLPNWFNEAVIEK